MAKQSAEDWIFRAFFATCGIAFVVTTVLTLLGFDLPGDGEGPRPGQERHQRYECHEEERLIALGKYVVRQERTVCGWEHINMEEGGL